MMDFWIQQWEEGSDAPVQLNSAKTHVTFTLDFGTEPTEIGIYLFIYLF